MFSDDSSELCRIRSTYILLIVLYYIVHIVKMQGVLIVCSLLAGCIFGVLGQSHNADGSDEQFESRVVEIVERILEDKRTDKPLTTF